MRHHVGVEGIAELVGLPQGASEQMLDAVGRGVAAHFCQLPGVFASCGTEQTFNVGHGALPRWTADKVGTQALRHLTEMYLPAANGHQGLLRA